MDEGVEFCEDELLRNSMRVMHKWLFFDSFRTLHEQEKMKALAVGIDEIVDAFGGEDLWKYVETRIVQKGKALYYAGDLDENLYILKSGRLSCYLAYATANGTMESKLVHKVRRGAFLNSDGMILSMPAAHTVVAEETSRVMFITKDMMV